MSSIVKTKRVLGLILLAFFAIAFRIWHLEVIQKEEKFQESEKPQRRTVILKADRGIICDRFGLPLAVNKISYNAVVYYSQIGQIPITLWQTDSSGKRVKISARKEYVRELSQILSKTLDVDAERVEDLIHAKASLFPHVPFTIKAQISEEEFYRLKMLEKDWLGIHGEITSTRHYPLGKTGCHVLGHLGAINQKEFGMIAEELNDLETAADLQGFITDEDRKRLEELKERAYAINDIIGKSGVEKQYEERLRGLFGKKIYEVDQKGRYVREVAQKSPIPGEKITLTISSELQEFAETLLAENEKMSERPWIKGGAIVVLDPKSGDIVALASHPRYDPNDFSLQNKQISHWLENESFIGDLWDGKVDLLREKGSHFAQESKSIDMNTYLDWILPKASPLRDTFRAMDVKTAIQLQEDYEAMSYFSFEKQEIPADIQKRLKAFGLQENDLLFAADLAKIFVYAPAFSDTVISKIGSMSLNAYRKLSKEYFSLEREAKKQHAALFHNTEFKAWRNDNQKDFLAQKRKEEKERKTYARPYTDYLDKQEKELFSAYWEAKKWEVLASEKFPIELMRTFRSFADLDRPLFGKYAMLRNRHLEQTEKDLAAAFYPMGGFGFGRSLCFGSGVPQGSLFKLVTAYEGLRQGKELQLIDEVTARGVAFHMDHTPYPRIYKGGRLPRSAAGKIGPIDLSGAIEQTSNPYFSILAGTLDDPEDLVRAARLFGFGEKTGIDLSGEKKGRLPHDLKTNRTGLYSTAIGQHTLLTTPLQTAVMLAAIANGGDIVTPKVLHSDLIEMRQIPFPEAIRDRLLEGMDRVIWGKLGSARPTVIKSLLANPLLMREYLSLSHQLVGKTGTAEILSHTSVHPKAQPQMVKYTWFGGISFHDTTQEDPELVVVVFLRFGNAGKEAAPLAAQIINKWRDICKKHPLKIKGLLNEK